MNSGRTVFQGQQAAWSHSPGRDKPHSIYLQGWNTTLQCQLWQELLICKPVNSTSTCLQAGPCPIRTKTRGSSAPSKLAELDKLSPCGGYQWGVRIWGGKGCAKPATPEHLPSRQVRNPVSLHEMGRHT